MNGERLRDRLWGHATALDEIASASTFLGRSNELRDVATKLRGLAETEWWFAGEAPRENEELMVCFDDGDTQRAMHKEGAFYERVYNPYGWSSTWKKLHGVKEWRYLRGDEK